MIEAPSPAAGPAPVLPRGWALRQGLRANPLLLAGGLTVVLIVVAATLAPLLAPFPGDAATATHPFLVLRMIGGVMFLIGGLIMAYNLRRTVTSPTTEAPRLDTSLGGYAVAGE